MEVNSTTDAKDYLPLPILASIVLFSTVGIIGSLIVILLSVCSAKLNGDFKYFIANVAIVDCCAVTLCYGYFLLVLLYPNHDYPFAVEVNRLLDFGILSNFLASMTVMLPNTFSRHILFRSVDGIIKYKKYFRPSLTFIYFVTVDIYPYLLVGFYKLIPSSFVTLNTALYLLYFLTFIGCFCLIAFSAVKLHKRLKSQLFVSGAGLTAKEAANRRDVLRAFLYQACVPLLCQIPRLLMVLLYLFFALDKRRKDRQPWKTIQSVLYMITLMNISLAPIWNVVIVFTIIKPYRRALRAAVFCAMQKTIPASTKLFNVQPTQFQAKKSHMPTTIVIRDY